MRVFSRFQFVLAWVFLPVIAISGFAFAQGSHEKQAATAGRAVADPRLIDLSEYNQVLQRYHGKALLVTFWATWCEPCRDEYPMIVNLAKKYAPQGLAVFGVSLDEDADMNLVRHFLATNHPGFPNYRQKPGIDVDAFYEGVNPGWGGVMPQTIFYGRDGHIARYFLGAKTPEAFEDAIRLILVKTDAEENQAQQTYAER